ncbi:Nephrocystin-3 [Durusdinium trenchii]|uniref:Nephrocystin-3 n=1 Tax=Durusdinium trenchii TaxID=1381693 RepID=A0ABP0H6L9_9DINO
MKSAGSCRESMNESRSSVEAMFQSKLGESGRLERRSCVDVLQSLGLTFQEANTLLKEYSEDSWICVKDFLDVLFAPPEVQKAEESMQERNQPGASTALEVHKAETSVKEGSDVKKPSTSEAHLGKYFQKDYKNGGAFKNEEYEFDPDDWCWVHKGLKIKVWADALDLTQAGGDGDVECYFHYTTELGFRNITHASKAAVEVFASLITSGEKANAWWGKGVYSVRKAPDEWPSVETILDNNYRNMLKRDIDLKGREAAIQDYQSRVEFCIPILVNASIAYDVSKRPTPEMLEQGKPAGVNLAGKLLNEAGKPPRECIVVRAQGESDIGNARAVLVETLRCRAEAAVTRRGPTDGYTLQALSRLASVLEDRGDLAEAEALCRRVLEGDEAQWGAEHQQTLTALSNLASVLKQQGKYEEAEALYRKALEGREARLGARHLDTLLSLSNLASLLWRQGKFEEAEALNRKALEGKEAQLGDRHPDTLSSLNNLAALLFGQGKLEEAEPLFRRQLEGIEAQLGASHPNTLTFANNLGVLLLDRRKLDESEVFLHRAVEGREAQLGSHHPETLRSVYHLARLSAAQGRLEEAQSHFRRAMEGQEAQLGVRHQETLDSISGLAKLLEAKGSMEEAQELRSKGS